MKKNEEIFMDFVKKGFYSINRNGHVFQKKIKKGNKYIDIKPNRIGTKMSNGYRQITRRLNDGKRIKILEHRLVWIYFNGPIPPGIIVNHKKGIRYDNRISQLELMTYSENNYHSYRILGNKGKKGSYKKKLIKN